MTDLSKLPGLHSLAMAEAFGNTRLGKAMQGLGFKKSWAKGYYLWMTGCCPSTQSVSVHETAARAYVAAMKPAGVALRVASRLD
jgi:hypothetical protein